MDRDVILSLLKTTAANWFGSAPAQPQRPDVHAHRRAGVALAALRCAMDALEPCKAVRPAFGAGPAPAVPSGALA